MACPTTYTDLAFHSSLKDFFQTVKHEMTCESLRPKKPRGRLPKATGAPEACGRGELVTSESKERHLKLESHLGPGALRRQISKRAPGLTLRMPCFGQRHAPGGTAAFSVCTRNKRNLITAFAW